MITVLSSSHYRRETDFFLKYAGITISKPDQLHLQKILAAFSLIPYENVSKIIRYSTLHLPQEALFRFPDVLWDDFRRFALGGTCFSLTFFLQTILENCGYTCYPVSADMKWGQHVHCALVVKLEDQAWLCDPGYLLQEPLLLNKEKRTVFHTPVQGVSVYFTAGRYHLTTFQGKQIKWRYSFPNAPCARDDFIKWWLQSFQEVTKNGICLTRREKQDMIYVHNNYFREVNREGIKKRRIEQNWLSRIEEIFGIPQEMLKTAYDITCQYRSNDGSGQTAAR